MENFISDENVQILWEVILDEDILKSTTSKEQIHILFNEQLIQFYKREKIDSGNNAPDLFQMNSQFISTFLNKINNTLSTNTLSNNTLSNKPSKGLVTVEELHADRLNSFDTDLANKRREFDSAMSVPIPETPHFKDTVNNNEDKPINEMEKLIAQTLAERNYELEQIYKNNDTTNSNMDSNWLQSKET